MAIMFNGNINDIKKLQAIAADHGLLCSYKELSQVWEGYSKNRGAEWLTLSDRNEQELWDIIWANIPMEEN